MAIRDELERFMKRIENRSGYQRIVSPHLAKADLYRRSGHLRAFSENMYPPMQSADMEDEFYLKPMNCPHHHKVFSSAPRSYRQLPLRIAEFGQVYRNERSGSLKGLSRVRGLCQNDAHIYIDPSDAQAEIGRVLDLHEHCYSALGLRGYRYRLSLHDPERKQDFDGPAADWIQCEEILRRCLREERVPFFEAVGEAAFYGPKIDVQMPMGAGEEESIASIQLDFNSADKFDLIYVGRSGEDQKPWIIHRAPLGSHERFVALLLEYFDGQLPGWLSPVQIFILPVGDAQLAFAQQLELQLRENDIRVKVDHGVGSLSKRVLFAHRARPFVKLVLGAREVQAGKLLLELRDRKIEVRSEDIVSVLQHLVLIP